jgi:GNAT superfamily N-acetyltransferase
MVAEIVVRQCVEGEVAALEAAEPPGSGIARHLLNLQAGGNIVFAAAWRGHDVIGTVVLDLASEHRPELKHLFVQAASRGAGAGAALCAWVECRAAQAGFEKLYLGVGIANHRARRLYKRLGFRPAGETTTTTYQYFDHAGQKQWATETDEVFGKAIRPLPGTEKAGGPSQSP